MTDVMLRHDLKTAGGEVSDILWNNQFVGTMTLVYREGDRISGAIQLEEESLPPHGKERVASFLQHYLQTHIDALAIESCDVLLTYSDFDQIISTDVDEEMSALEDVEQDDEMQWADNDRFRVRRNLDENEYVVDDYSEAFKADMAADEDVDYGYFELVLIEETADTAVYHIHDEEQELVAEAEFHLTDRDVTGTVNWRFEPGDEELEAVADLLVHDFDEDAVDTISINMQWDDQLIETFQLAHEDYLDDAQEDILLAEGGARSEDDYSVVLVRDDGDALTYEIYQASYGPLPIGTATVDISQRALTGFIDFREPGDSDDREFISQLLMQELDKEKDFESFNVTMLYQNEPFEELLFESEQVH
ncbi:hypothetical protein [Paenibacillus xerothermodurans]|uniref:Uncharacterized protein n=1 Tax=Paenibacillus xerothermodurans TaxID=1977292 RepID=A0A2W1NCY7_PAEXE|nr:hypothetical protein [Paenibacillus xerothermodurans]PZE20941.1 hypothetical protein CBW46_009630 [Paenibacillus xerothermodurans]